MPYHTDIRYMISDRYVFFRPVTDHKAVYLSIFGRNLFHLKSVASLKQHNVRRRIFNYDNMDDDKWQLFTDQTDIELQLFLNHQMTLHTSAALDYWWGILQRCINKAAIKTIDNHLSSGSHKDPQPKHLSDAHNNIRFLNKCLYVIRSKMFQRGNIAYVQKRWSQWHSKISDISSIHSIPFNLPSIIDQTNVSFIRKDLRSLHSTLLKKFDLLNKNHELSQIKRFVQQRCDDYKNDKGHMIDSLLERDHRKIIIDRLYKPDQQLLITNPDEIKSLTNAHFQTCANSVNDEKVIPPRWQSQFAPQDSVDDNIYDSLMLPPTFDEWSDVVQHLPKQKAAGPSKITNEMLQHLGSTLSKHLWQFVCACLRLNDAPSAWKSAELYPIPKPKEWFCDLNNTRPIVLLETTRKAMIRLLNNRLAKIMVDHQVLKGNQFAGLPGTSTFEPLHILNEIVQDAKEQKQEIWVLFQDLSKAYDRVNIPMLRKAMECIKLPSSFINLISNIFTNRWNRVFTAVGTTDPYEMLTSIDQGEVMSPLLWCIYYDPLLCEINDQELG